MEFECQRIAALLEVVDGPRDKAFILAAFPEVPEAEIDGALVALALDGKITIGPSGINIAKEGKEAEAVVSSVSAEATSRFRNPTVEKVAKFIAHENGRTAARGPVSLPESKPSKVVDLDALWTTPIEWLNLREPIIRNLNRSNIHTLNELVERSESDLMSLRGMGAKKVKEILDALAEVGLSLGRDPRHPMSDATIDVLSQHIDALNPDPVSIEEWLSTMKENRKQVMELRLSGLKFRQIGDVVGTSRQRIQQIETSCLKKRPPLKEDSFRDFFDAYDLSEEEFCTITGEPKATYYYLKITSDAKREDKQPLEAMLDDPNVPEEYKQALRESDVDAGAIYIDGQRIQKNKHDIAAYILKEKFGGERTSLNDLYDAYMAFLEERGLTGEKRLDPTSRRAFKALLERNPEMILTPSEDPDEGGTLRAFDTSVDFSPLEDAIGALAGQNVECSAAWLFANDEVASAARALDLRSGNELHVAMNRYCGDIPGVTLGRLPMVVLGNGNRDEQVLKLIEEMSPASALQLGDAYEQRYGVASATFRGSFLRDFESYLHDGKYEYEPVLLSQEEREFVHRELERNGGYMPLSVLKDQFKLRYPGTPANYLNNESIAQADCRVSGRLVISGDLDMAAIFQGIIENNDYINEGTQGVGPDVLGNQEFLAELNKALRRFSVVEYEKGNYLSTRVLAEMPHPVYADDMRGFLDSAIEFMKLGVPYSIKSLKAAGLSHPLFELEDYLPVKDFFYESILGQGYVGGALKRTPFDNVTFFCRKDGWFSITDVLEYAIDQKGLMTLDELRGYLADEYGLVTERAKLLLTVKRAELAWDSETDMVSRKAE